MAIGTCSFSLYCYATCKLKKERWFFPPCCTSEKQLIPPTGSSIKNKVRNFEIRDFSYPVHNDASHSPIHKWLNLPQEKIRRN